MLAITCYSQSVFVCHMLIGRGHKRYWWTRLRVRESRKCVVMKCPVIVVVLLSKCCTVGTYYRGYCGCKWSLLMWLSLHWTGAWVLECVGTNVTGGQEYNNVAVTWWRERYWWTSLWVMESRACVVRECMCWEDIANLLSMVYIDVR